MPTKKIDQIFKGIQIVPAREQFYDKNSFLAEWMIQKRELCTGFSLSLPYAISNKHNGLKCKSPKRSLLSTMIFCAGAKFFGKFEHSSPVCLQLDFLNIGFNRIIGINQVVIRARVEIRNKRDVVSGVD